MKNRASNTRNLLWAVGILLCLVAMLVALIFAMSRKNTGNRADGTLVLGHIERGEKPVDVDLAGLESTANQLMPVPETKKGNLEDVFGMTFLLDKTLMGLRSYVTNYGDGLSPQLIASANSWIRQVCTDTGAYYADIAAIVNDEQGFLSDEFLTPDGRSIAAAGIALIVDYLRCHYM